MPKCLPATSVSTDSGRRAKEMEKYEVQNMKKYDLEERTMAFARRCRLLAYALQRDTVSHEDVKQLIRSSGSVAANFIESRESLSRKDCLHRLKICRKEAKESHLWISLLQIRKNPSLSIELQKLFQESLELTLIFGSIVTKLGNT